MSNAISTYATITSFSTACVVINNYLYVTGEKTHMVRVNLDTGVVENSWLSAAQGFKRSYYGAYAIAGDSQYVYSIMPYTYYGINISRTPYDNPNGGTVDWVKDDTNTGGYFSSAYHYGGNIYLGQSGAKIYRVNTTSKAISLFYTHSAEGITAMVHYNGFLYYVCGSTRGLFKVSITNPAAGSAQLVTNSGDWGSSQILNGLTVFNDNLFVSFQWVNRIGQLGLIDTSKFNTTFSNNANMNNPTGIVVYNGSLYIVNYYSASVNKVTVPTLYVNLAIPTNISIDTGNTYTVASGNVQVSIIDTSNSTSNAIFYWYSTDGGNTYTQTTASPSGSAAITTRFYITGLSFGQKTIYVIAKNTLGNSTPVNTTVNVLVTPTAISNCSVSSIGSGNINVSITETSPPTNYYLNAVSYLYYLYTSGTNQSANGAAYSVGANLQSTSYTTNFVIQNQSANNYRVYLIAKNSVGNTVASAFSANVTVLTTPVSPDSYSLAFDISNGISVSITDTQNVAKNQIYYYYYYYRVGDAAPNQSTDINMYSNSYVPLTSGTTSYSFNIKGLEASYYNIYIAAKNSIGANIFTPAVAAVNVICFKEGSRILTHRGYKKIQHLRKGDLVKTFKDGFKPIYKIGKKEISHSPTSELSKEHLYKCSTTQYPELFEDLVLTGCHSLLVDKFEDDEQRDQTRKINGGIYVTDKKYRLPVCADPRASIYEKAGKYMVYHIALEHDDYYMNYGIYANGLLVESTSKRFLDEYKVMDT